MQMLKLTKKYEKYPEYKDSGVEWLGKIPKDWKYKKLKSIFTLSNERVVDNPDVTTILSVSGYRGVEIRKNIETFDGQMPSENVDTYRVVRKNQLVANTMWLNFAGLGVSKYEGYVSPAYRAYNISKEMVPEYVNHLMRSDPYVQKYSSLLYGLRPNSLQVKPYDFEKIEILYPDINEQKRIFKYLDEKTSYIDQIIEKKQKLIELLREKRTSVINNAVTKGLDQKVELVESGITWIGKMPKGWKLDKIKRVVFMNKRTLSENTNPNFSFKYFDIGSVDEEEVSSIESEITFSKAPSRARRIVSVGDSIIATVRTYLKAIAYFDKLDTDTIASTGFAVLTPKNELNPKYLFYYLQSDRFINQVIIKSKGIGYPAITPFDLGSLEIIYPEKNIQQSIVTNLDENIGKFNSIIERAERSIKLLSEFKYSLVSNVVTGKIKV